MTGACVCTRCCGRLVYGISGTGLEWYTHELSVHPNTAAVIAENESLFFMSRESFFTE